MPHSSCAGRLRRGKKIPQCISETHLEATPSRTPISNGLRKPPPTLLEVQVRYKFMNLIEIPRPERKWQITVHPQKKEMEGKTWSDFSCRKQKHTPRSGKSPSYKCTGVLVIERIERGVFGGLVTLECVGAWTFLVRASHQLKNIRLDEPQEGQVLSSSSVSNEYFSSELLNHLYTHMALGGFRSNHGRAICPPFHASLPSIGDDLLVNRPTCTHRVATAKVPGSSSNLDPI